MVIFCYKLETDVKYLRVVKEVAVIWGSTTKSRDDPPDTKDNAQQ